MSTTKNQYRISWGEPSSREYEEIGHRDSDSLLWANNHRGSLEVRAILDGTHNSIWGPRAMGMWRGRIDPGKMEISIVPPIGYEGGLPPPHLVDTLRAEFNTDMRLLVFDPEKTQARFLTELQE